MKECMTQVIEESNHVNKRKVELDSKVESLTKNVKYLEDKIAKVLNEKEDQIIRLKSEKVLYKNKINKYKQRLLSQVDAFESKKVSEIENKYASDLNHKI